MVPSQDLKVGVPSGIESIAVEGAGDGGFHTRRSVAVVWRRLAAFAVDFLILAAVGFVMGTAGGHFFSRLGNWGKLVGFITAFLYFVPQDSAMGYGQTLGKRLLGVRVVDAAGGYISLPISALRYIIVSAPIFLNGLVMPPGSMGGLAAYAVYVAVFGLGGGIIYFGLFNRATRQSLHDIVCGTFVMKEDVDGAPTGRSPATLHFVVYGVYFAALIAFLVVGIPMIISTERYQGMSESEAALEQIKGVRGATVSSGNFLNFGDSGNNLRVIVLLESPPESYRDVANKAAGTALRSYRDIGGMDSMRVDAEYGYDIGIYRFYTAYSVIKTPDEWKKALGMGPAK